MQLYLDCDGVLADFNKKALEIFEMTPGEFEEKYGTAEFWKRIHNTHDFYFVLDVLEDARVLYDGVKHLNPIILTGVSGNHADSRAQKERWAHKVFGAEQKVICCLSKEKCLHCKPGDILVDDWLRYKHLWEEAGGIFIVHTSAEDSLKQLRDFKALD